MSSIEKGISHVLNGSGLPPAPEPQTADHYGERDRSRVVADAFRHLDDTDLVHVRRMIAERDAATRDAWIDNIAKDIDGLPMREMMKMAKEIIKVEGYKDTWPNDSELAMTLMLWSQTRAKPESPQQPRPGDD